MVRIHLGCCGRHQTVIKTVRHQPSVDTVGCGRPSYPPLSLPFRFGNFEAPGFYIRRSRAACGCSGCFGGVVHPTPHAVARYWVSASTRSRSAKIRSYPRPIPGRWSEVHQFAPRSRCRCMRRRTSPHPEADEITAGEVPYSVGFAGAESLP